MKGAAGRFRSLIFAFICLLASCETDTEVGVEVRPSDDAMAVKTRVFPVETSLLTVDSIYARSSDLLLGSYSDPLFGTVKADFLAELRYVADTFPAGSTPDSLVFVLFYHDFYGDSLAVQEMSAFTLDKALDFSTDYYSNILPSDFTSCANLFARKAYVPYDLTVPASDRVSSYVDRVRVRMPDDMMRTLFSDKSLTESQEAFRGFLNGLYVTNTYGEDCLLQVDSINLELSYHITVTSGTEVTTVNSYHLYAANREATEVLRVEWPLGDRPTAATVSADYADSVTFISSPAGLFTRVRLPFDSIYREVYLNERASDPDYALNVNHAAMVVETADVGYEGKLEPPAALLMIRPSDMEAFFTQSLYPVSGIPTVLGVYDSSKGGYTFGNMGAFVQSVLQSGEQAFSEVSEFVLVPVSGATSVSSSGSTIRHLLKPSGVALRSGANRSPMRISVTYTRL